MLIVGENRHSSRGFLQGGLAYSGGILDQRSSGKDDDAALGKQLADVAREHDLGFERLLGVRVLLSGRTDDAYDDSTAHVLEPSRAAFGHSRALARSSIWPP